jgi:hypothetical protein
MSVPTETIIAERLARWSKRLREAHATPALLIAVSHDDTSGQLIVCTVENFSDAEICRLLRYALRELEPQ